MLAHDGGPVIWCNNWFQALVLEMPTCWRREKPKGLVGLVFSEVPLWLIVCRWWRMEMSLKSSGSILLMADHYWGGLHPFRHGVQLYQPCNCPNFLLLKFCMEHKQKRELKLCARCNAITEWLHFPHNTWFGQKSWAYHQEVWLRNLCCDLKWARRRCTRSMKCGNRNWLR